MTRLQYKLEYPGFTDYTYNILQIKQGAPYQFFFKDTLIGSIEKLDGEWQQTSGRQTLNEIVEGMGNFIDANV